MVHVSKCSHDETSVPKWLLPKSQVPKWWEAYFVLNLTLLTEPRRALQPKGTQWFPRIGLFVVRAISLGPCRRPIEFLTSSHPCGRLSKIPNNRDPRGFRGCEIYILPHSIRRDCSNCRNLYGSTRHTKTNILGRIKVLLMKSCALSPSQSVPTILVLKTWVGLWPWHKSGPK